MGREGGEKWTAAADLQPAIPKPDRLLGQPQVFGVPDGKYGEEVCAWVVLKPGASATAQDIRDFCRERIAHYKVPKTVRFVSEMPMTVTGKPQKFVMRDRMMAELGISPPATA